MNFRFDHVDSSMPCSEKSSPFEHKLIGDIIKEYPGTSEIIKRYFGERSFSRADFKIKILETACLLFGVDRNRLIQELEKIKSQ